MASRTRAETLENLRAHGIEPEEAFLDDFTKFGKVTQDRLIAVSYTHLTLPTIYSV